MACEVNRPAAAPTTDALETLLATWLTGAILAAHARRDVDSEAAFAACVHDAAEARHDADRLARAQLERVYARLRLIAASRAS
jgi:hypothetical protein